MQPAKVDQFVQAPKQIVRVSSPGGSLSVSCLTTCAFSYSVVREGTCCLLPFLPVALDKSRIDLPFNKAGMVENLPMQRNGRLDPFHYKLGKRTPHASQGGQAGR